MLWEMKCIPPPQLPSSPPRAVVQAPVSPQRSLSVRHLQPASFNGLMGSRGYALSGGNCVDLAKQYGKNQPGNPSSWIPSTRTPFIGAAALFYYNHVAIVVGINSDGTVELAHYNCPGCEVRVSSSSLRGFF